MLKLIIIRGLPGSGKSTLAANIINCQDGNYEHFEADMFFQSLTGEYEFISNLIGIAHDWCYSNTIKALLNGHNVVVSNTFTKKWELESYLAIATLIPNVEIIVYEMKNQYGNIHNVPEKKLKQMADRWEEIPEEWKNSLKDFIVIQ